KWLLVNQIIRDSKIGILALQETHLTKEEESKLNELFKSKIRIISSINEEHTKARGVALVLNNRTTNTKNIKEYELIPGRALLIQVPWHDEELINVMA
ncbi:hypothetical protein BJ138DRAFT_994185, partial [Hygrophoropsis aurantiaca]